MRAALLISVLLLSGCALPEIEKTTAAGTCPGVAIPLGSSFDDDTTGKPVTKLPPPLYCEINRFGSNYRLGIYRMKAVDHPALTVRLITTGDFDAVLDMRAECNDDIEDQRLACADDVAKGGTEVITGSSEQSWNQIFIYAFVEEGGSYTIQTELSEP